MTGFMQLRRSALMVFGLAAMAIGVTGCGGGSGGGNTGPGAGGTTAIKLEQVFPGLTFDSPVLFLQAPGNNDRWYVVERGGKVLTFTTANPVPTTFADISGRIALPGPPAFDEEVGLLGMAFHPQFPTKAEVFLSYTDTGFNSTVSRFTSDANGVILDTNSEQIILNVPFMSAYHNGGHIAFGPNDNYLYIGLGDHGWPWDTPDNSQNTQTLLGAILRIDVDGGTPYGIPADNPFVASAGCGAGAGCPELYAWGLRNPWRWSFDRNNGDLWAGDVGRDDWDEINKIEKGKNYGWSCFEGNQATPGLPANDRSGCGPATDYAPPFIAQAINGGGVSCSASITGGYVYRGTVFSGLAGTYIYGDFCTGKIWGADTSANTTLLLDSTLMIASFGEANDGELYVLDFAGGGIYKVVEP